MGCTIAAALLGVCQFTFAGEPVSPHAMISKDRPAQEWLDARAAGRQPIHGEAVLVERRRGRIYVRPRG